MRLLGLLGTCSLLWACKPVTGISEDGDVIDAGTTTGDAAGGDADAGGAMPDAASDNPDAATSGVARIVVTDEWGTGIGDLAVVWHNPDGTSLARATTTDTGEASQVIERGAMVTIAYDYSWGIESNFALVTVTDLQPGDQVEIGHRGPAPPSYELVGNLSVKLPGQWSQAAMYEVQNGCPLASDLAPDSITTFELWDNDCLRGNDPFPLIATARFDDYRPAAYSLLENVSATGSDPSNPYSFNEWRTDFQRIKVDAINSPVPGYLELTFHPYWREVQYALGQPQGTTVGAGGGYSQDFLFVPDLAGRAHLRAKMSNGDMAFQELHLAVPPRDETLQLDLADHDMPQVVDVELDRTNNARPQMRWNVKNGSLGDRATGGTIVAAWTGTTGNRRWLWQLIVPPWAVSPFQFPEIPNDFIEHPGGMPAWPPPVVTTSITGSVVLFAAVNWMDGWEQLRQDRASALFFDHQLPIEAPDGNWTHTTGSGFFQEPRRSQ